MVVADSGPLIHLAIVERFFLLKHFFSQLLIIPQVYDEVVTQGQGRPGEAELRQAVQSRWVLIAPVPDPVTVRRLVAPQISLTDAAVVAGALERNATIVLADDAKVRDLAEREGVEVIGSIGILVQARLTGVIDELKPILDRLVATGFHLNPQGQLYAEALRKAGEIK